MYITQLLSIQKMPPSLIAISLLVLALLVSFFFYFKHRKKSALKIKGLEDKVQELQTNYEREIIREAATLFEREMQQMGADLHDDLVQKLAGFRLFMDRMERADSRSELESILMKMNSEFTRVVDSVRRISRRLLPEAIEAGSLNSALNELCNRIGPDRMAHIHLTIQGVEHNLLREEQLHLFRIVQELTNNIVKHTVAWHIWIRVYWFLEKLVIEVEDDGLHHEQLAHAIENQEGKSFLTLQKRAMLIGADLSYAPAEKGTRAMVELVY